ncbi:MAG: dTMP kinase [Candidatus Hadarchaeales archaeon]
MGLRGRFISLDGPDGCGKSTHARLLARWLRLRGYSVVLTEEPTDSVFGSTIKKALRGEFSLPADVEAVLFAADRAYHVSRVIKPALRAGRIVVTARYVHSSLAYQPARGVSEKWVLALNRGMPRPDLTVILDVPTVETMRRVSSKRPDVFESSADLQRKVRENYIRLARHEGLMVVDSTRPRDEVQREIRAAVGRLLRIGERSSHADSV